MTGQRTTRRRKKLLDDACFRVAFGRSRIEREAASLSGLLDLDAPEVERMIAHRMSALALGGS